MALHWLKTCRNHTQRTVSITNWWSLSQPTIKSFLLGCLNSEIHACTFFFFFPKANNVHNIRVNSKYAACECERRCWLNWKRAQTGFTHTQTHPHAQNYILVIIFCSQPLSSHQRCLTRRPADQLARAMRDCRWWRQSDGDVETKAGGERQSVYPTQKSMEDNLAQHFVLLFFFFFLKESLPLRAKSWLEAVGYFSQDVRLYAFMCVRVCTVCVIAVESAG